ncbi:hypothetical protein U1Q18_051455 [Sarracenia purpurea var. burkii]
MYDDARSVDVCFKLRDEAWLLDFVSHFSTRRCDEKRDCSVECLFVVEEVEKVVEMNVICEASSVNDAKRALSACSAGRDGRYQVDRNCPRLFESSWKLVVSDWSDKLGDVSALHADGGDDLQYSEHEVSCA